MRSTETLPAREHSNYERQERIITEAMAERWLEPQLPAGDLTCWDFGTART